MSDEYEDEFATPDDHGVPPPPSSGIAGVKSIDRRLVPLLGGCVVLAGAGLFYVMHASSQPLAATAEAHAPMLDSHTSLRLAGPSPTPIALAASSLPTLRPTPPPASPPPPADAAAPAAPPPRTPSPEEAYAAQERERVLLARRAPIRVAIDDASTQSFEQQAANDTQTLAQGAQMPGSVPITGGASRSSPAGADGPQAQFVAAQTGAPGYLPQTSQYELRRGTVINANWATTVDSTLPGGVLVARVSQNVYDSVTHTIVVLPAGTLLTGQGDSQTVAGEARYLCAFDEVEMPYPDSRKFYLGPNPGSGRQGENGATVSVDTHAGRQFGQAFLYSALQAGVNAASRASSVNIGTGSNFISQPVALPPTYHAYVGQPLTVIVARDLPLDAFRTTQ